MRRSKSFPLIEKTVLASLVLSSSLSIAAPASAQVIQNLANFNVANGAKPYDSLTLGNNGIFYGTTSEGGPNERGSIFSFNPATNALTDLANFNYTNGAYPFGSLTLGSNGLFYGTTSEGGPNNYGTIFSFNPTNNELTDIAFNAFDGVGPHGSLTLGSNGLFYGTTWLGGTNNEGTIFSFNPHSAGWDVIRVDFQNYNLLSNDNHNFFSGFLNINTGTVSTIRNNS